MTSKIPDSPDSSRIQELVAPLTNYERTRPNRPRWSLDNMRTLLARPGASRFAGRAVQVGGSKGKGCTTMYLAAMAARLGMRTGVYQSPHLQDLSERVLVDGVPAATLVDVVEEIVDHVRGRAMRDVTFFEVMTAAAVECFARESVELAVFEVGLGGRLDATTAVDAAAVILTGVELEHTELLGDSIEAIAAEKAAIIRTGRPAITASTGVALDVIEARAAEVDAKLDVLGRDFDLEQLSAGPGREVGGLLVDGAGRRVPFRLPQASHQEAPALALAWRCLGTLCPERRPGLDRILDSCSWRPTLAARFEVVPDRSGPLVLDVAHTEASLRASAVEMQRLAPGGGWTVLFACAAGKRWRRGLRWLLPLVDRAIVTTLQGTTGEDPATVCAWFRAEGVAARVMADHAEAFAELGRGAGPQLVVGSFYLAGAVRTLLGLSPYPAYSVQP